jgi:hypothetical protein
MTRLLTRCFFLATFLFLFSLPSCDKDKTTTVNCTVVDKHSGVPIDSAQIEFKIRFKDDLNAPNCCDYAFVYSDENGKFEYSHEKPISFYGANKYGYLLSGPGADFPKIIRGETNDLSLKLTPKDGLLKLILKNNGQSNKFHVGIYSPLQDSEFGLTNGLVFRDSLYIENASEVIKIINLASEESISLFWGLMPLPYDLSKVQIQGSVYVTRNDTTTFNIIF